MNNNPARKHYPKEGVDLSLFDLPGLLRASMDKLRSHGIGRVHPYHLVITDQHKLLVHIHYFEALDKTGAEGYERGVDKQGAYINYRLTVNQDCDLVWVKRVLPWQ